MRLTNETDRPTFAHVQQIIWMDSSGCCQFSELGNLIIGEAVGLPVRVLIDLPPANRRPDGDDPLVVVPRTLKVRRSVPEVEGRCRMGGLLCGRPMLAPNGP